MQTQDDDLSLFTDDEATILQKIMEAEAAMPKPAMKEQSENKDHLLIIYDSLLTKGFYEEAVTIGKSLPVVWRSRTLGQANSIARIIDSAGFSTILAAQNHTNTLNLAASLVAMRGASYADKKLSEKKEFIENLPEVLIIQLSKSLSDFDKKVAEAMEYGKENF